MTRNEFVEYLVEGLTNPDNLKAIGKLQANIDSAVYGDGKVDFLMLDGSTVQVTVRKFP